MIAEPPEADPALSSQKRTIERVSVEVAIRLVILAVLVYLALRLLQPFLPILSWSIILTVALYPIFAWVRDRLGGRGLLASMLVTACNLLVIFGPVAALTANLVRSLEVVAEGVANRTLQIPAPPEALTSLPFFGKDLHDAWTLAISNSREFFSEYGHTLVPPSEWLLSLLAGLAGSVVVFAIAIFVAGFLFLSGPKMLNRVFDVSNRIAGHRGAEYVALAGATIRSVARGVIGVSAAQALVIGVGLIVAGVPHAGILTFLALVLAIVQVGTAPVVILAVVWYWLTQATVPAILFTGYMALAYALEHILKPLAMGHGLKTPLIVILVGVIGGTLVFGLHGLFMGPIVLAVCFELFTFWTETEKADGGSAPEGQG